MFEPQRIVTRLSPPEPARAARVCLVVSAYNEWITSKLRDGAVEAFERLAPAGSRLVEVSVPGAFELPAASAAFAERNARSTDAAVVALGCVIRGETTHDQHINTSVATALSAITVRTVVPVAFGVITANDADQAEARAGGAVGNKGAEAMEAALETIGALRAIEAGER